MPSSTFNMFRKSSRARRGVRSGAAAIALIAACATCDASTALAPAQARAVALSWDGDTIIVAGSSVSTDVSVMVDGAPHSFARLRLTSSHPDVVSVAPDGRTLEGRRVGTAVITAQLLDASLPSPAPSIATTVVVSPSALQLGTLPDTLRSIGDTARLSATPLDAAGRAIADVPLRWTSSATAVATVDATGLVTALANGSAVIEAEAAGARASATIVVRQRPASIRFSLPSLRLDALGADTTLTVGTHDARGVSLGALAPVPVWSVQNASTATVADGRVTAVANGSTWVRVAAGTLRDSIAIEVAQRATRVVIETPSPVALRSRGESTILTARAYDRLNREVQSAVPTWRSLHPLIVHVEAQTGIATALAEGTASVTAGLDDAAATVVVEVADVPARLVLAPETATMTSVGDTLLPTWQVYNARGATIAAVAVTMRSTDTTIIRTLADGRVPSVGTGTARLIASTATGLADTTLVTVLDAVAHVAITPDLVTLTSVGDTAIPPAAIRNERGAELPRSAATWTSDDAGVARVSAGGIVIAVGTGETVVRAASPYYPDRRDSLVVSVTNAPASVVIERDVDALAAVGLSRTYAAEVRNARGALLSTTAAWRSLDVSLASVTSGGTVTGIAVGTARIVATAGAVADTLLLTVQNDVVALEVLPSAITLTSVGDAFMPSATGRSITGALISNVGVTWASTDSTVAKLQVDGSVLATATGTSRLIASAANGVADTALVTVVNAVAHVGFVPDLVSLASVGDTVIPAASIRNERGAELPRSAATWTSDDAGVARVSAGGVVIAVASGETVVRATSPYHPDRRDSVAIVVTNAPASVVIERDVDALAAVGLSRTYAAEVRNARGALLTTAPAWRTLDAPVASVSAAGVVTSVGVGTARIVATAGAVADTLLLTVRNDIISLDVTPASITLTSVGDAFIPAVTARSVTGATVSNPIVTWLSTDSTVAKLAADGSVLAVGTGTSRVIATAAGLADTTVVTVLDAVAHVAIVPDHVTLTSVGDTVIPVAAIRNERGAELPRSAATWTSDDAGVARVSAGGIVIAVGAGETVVRAASPYYLDRRDSLVVSVTNAPASVVIERDVDALAAVGLSRTYAAEVRNARGALLTTAPAWRTLDAPVASVSAAGVVTSVGVGTARIVATAGAAADTLVLTVRDDIVSLDATPASITLTSLGDAFTPAVVARNVAGGVIASPLISWSVTDASVAQLQADGSVVAGAVGTSRVIATAGALADTILVTVTNLPVLIDITGTTDTIQAVGDSVVLVVTARNARGDLLPATSVTWSVDDPVVARVGTAGVVTARAEGSTWVRASGGTTQDSTLVVVTNLPGSLVMTLTATGAAAVVDTMTAAGQSLQYSAAVANLNGMPIAGASVAWHSTDASVVQVTSAGVVTGMGLGAAHVVATAGTVADSVRLIVVDPRRIYVDNAVVTAARFGTVARPYATIQDGVNAAGVDDTVIVHRGTSYSESVSIGRRITVLGDSAAYVTGGRDPLLLPLLRHDLGAAGIVTATPGASYTIRYLGIQHSVDGEAIVARDPDNLVLSDVYVNPVPGFRTGRGILVEGATGAVHIARSRVDSVYGFGIRVVDAGMATIEGATVRGVAARSGFSGAGIELVGGSGVVTGATVRRTAGPQVRFSRTLAASLIGSTLTGEQQLVRVDSATGATLVRNNTFDLRHQAGEPLPVRGGLAADPSGLEILRSAGVLVDGNVFTDIGGQSSLMDAIRLADVRVGTTGAAYGASITGNRFRGGRTAVRSARGTFTLSGSRVDSASVGVLLADADSVTLVADTLVDSRVAAIRSTGAAASVVMTQSLVSGAQRAVHVTGGGHVTLRNNTVAGAAFTGTAQPAAGAVDIDATTAEVAANTLSGIRGWAALALRGGTARADSNFISRNLVGVWLGSASASVLAGNSIFDNDTLVATARRAARGAVNEAGARAIGANWWGAPEGPRSDIVPGTARGDSTIGSIATPSLLVAPIAMHQGTGGSAAFATLRKVAGDQQAGVIAASLPVLLTVRAVDAAGRPLAGATVTFRVPNGSGDFVIGSGTRSNQGQNNGVAIVTDANGLAGAEYVPGAAGTATVTVSAGSGSTQTSFTFTVNVP